MIVFAAGALQWDIRSPTARWGFVLTAFLHDRIQLR